MAEEVKEKLTLLRDELIKSNSEFLRDKAYLEFGVFSGNSLIEMYELYKKYIVNSNTTFYGFDSFLGLPKEDKDINNPSYWTQGESNFLNFTLNSNIPSILLGKEDINIVDGWFDETLTTELSETIKQKIGLLHIDCDIYSSTYTALDFCFKHNLMGKGTIIMYDDWAGYWEKLGEGKDFEAGEGLAHTHIMEKYKRTCTFKNKHVIFPELYEVAVFVLD